ncbi:MAG: hypothetical protein ACE5JA_08965 [bacterium]
MNGTLFFGVLATIVLAASDIPPAEPDSDVSIFLQLGSDSATVGDRVPLFLYITHPDSMTFLPLEGKRSIGDVYLIGGGEKREGRAGEGMILDTLLAWIVPFNVGRVTVPPIKVLYETRTGLKGEVESGGSLIYVRSILPDEASDIRPLKPNVRAPSDLGSYILLGALLCLLAAMVALAVRIAHRRRQKRPVARFTPPARPAHMIAFEEFERIASLNLLARGRFKEFYSMLSETVKRYVGNRYGFETPDLTTAELVREMSRREISSSVIGEFKGFLDRSDLVKFAKLVPPYDEMESAIDAGRELVRKTMEREEEKEYREDARVPGGNE